MKSGKASAAVAGVRAGIQAGASSGPAQGRREALAQDPLSSDDILTGFYRPAPPRPQSGPRPVAAALPNPLPGTIIDHRQITPFSLPRPLRGPAEEQEGVDPPAEAEAETKDVKAKKAKPAHYKIVCISLYVEDIARLDALVAELKRRGHTKANKSQVIRAALEQIDLDKVPKAH